MESSNFHTGPNLNRFPAGKPIMAVAFSTTHSVTSSTSSEDGGGRIPVLFALWKSLFAAVDTLSTLSEDPEIQRLFEKRCEEITRIEVKIVSIRPQSLRELAMQAEVVRYYASQGDFDRDGVSQILANVIAYAA